MTLRVRHGQSTVEVMLVISVLAIVMVASTYLLVPDFQAGLLGQQQVVSKIVSDGFVDGG